MSQPPRPGKRLIKHIHFKKVEEMEGVASLMTSKAKK
jgi:hypothetical protein